MYTFAVDLAQVLPQEEHPLVLRDLRRDLVTSPVWPSSTPLGVVIARV
jgi:hypothetical protein